MKSEFRQGLIAGIPIALGYLSVSVGVGVMAVRAGLSILTALGISMTNLTSAGEAAGITVIAAGGTLAEIALTQFIINLRYSLMGISLSQRTSDNFSFFHRFICSFGITDEIFAVAATRQSKITPAFMYGLIFLPYIGWSLGTLLGAFAGEFLPQSISNAMGILLYGMFIDIIIPAIKDKKSVIVPVAIAIVLSVLFKYVFSSVPSGIAIIICAVAASAVAAIVSPISDKEEI